MNSVPYSLCTTACKMQRKPKGFIFQMFWYEKIKMIPPIYEWAVFQRLVYHLFQTQATFSPQILYYYLLGFHMINESVQYSHQ